ncbi:Sphingolipid delta(4)-desaturase DES1-like [Linum perenne]
MSVTFQKYHLEHHRFQGVDGIDMDIPSQAEAHLVTNIASKSIWVLLQLFFYALRPLFLKPKPPEHYVFNPDQETYSYYGPLNLLTWHVGYHNEHHDFPRIPGNKLHKVKEIAPEYYEGLECYRSWSQVIYMYVMDRTVGPFSRMKRKPGSGGVKKSE